ncbi:hypothetical protein [Orenia marismortui]|uniref:Uncharacterized protein n=1 Tax=Orenia marismortui TaxID=46469 RepID=A0A4R8H7Z1_9FIRM|nr:hypothetical protein [Orenia marismortui]TDX51688.1 hypothetical protein C7959_11184 [Orenia marismortui]
MKKSNIYLLITLFILIILIPKTMLASNFRKSEYDFREIKWGMNMKEVKKRESLEVCDEYKNKLIYITNIAHRRSGLVYKFNNQKLTTALYIFLEKHSNKSSYINDYQKLKYLLIKRYGTPLNSNKIWLNNNCSSKIKYGAALERGDLAFASIWETDKTKIFLLLFGANNDIELMIKYISKDYAYLIDKSYMEGL